VIEVEKRYIITKEQEENILKDTELLGEKIFTDIYYDDTNYSLTTNDIWLRRRDNKFELKIPLNKSFEKRLSDQYEEIGNEKDILNYFQANYNKTIKELITEINFIPFCKIKTIRRKYKKEGFNIDLDIADTGFAIMEIERMTDDLSKMKEITQEITQFAERNGIIKEQKWGKIIEYIRINNPQHFQALINAKLIGL